MKDVKYKEHQDVTACFQLHMISKLVFLSTLRDRFRTDAGSKSIIENFRGDLEAGSLDFKTLF